MTVEQVPQEKFPDRQPFNPPESPPQETDALTPRLKNPLIEKCLKQLVEKELLGGPYVKDYLHDQKRRNCRPNTIRSNFTTLMVFLSYLKERGRTSLETITREDVSSFIEHEQDRGMQPNTVSTRLRLLYAFVRYLVDREVVTANNSSGLPSFMTAKSTSSAGLACRILGSVSLSVGIGYLLVRGNHAYSGFYPIRLVTRSLQGNRVNWGYFVTPMKPYTPILPPYPAVHGNYRTAIDKEKPAICCQTRAFGTLKISLDYQVVPEAGLEPAQGCPRGILSPLRLPIPPLRQQ